MNEKSVENNTKTAVSWLWTEKTQHLYSKCHLTYVKSNLTLKMLLKSDNEEETILRLFKDINIDYNPSTIAKKVGMTREGAFIMLKDLEKREIVKSKRMGKANFYTLNLDVFVRKLIAVLLHNEARNAVARVRRYIRFDLEPMASFAHIGLLFGSVLRTKEYNDVDALIVMEPKMDKKIKEYIDSRNNVNDKRIHPVRQTLLDLEKNIMKGDKVILNILSNGIVAFGYEKYVEVIARCHK